jgi:NADH dehydrogenase FAD-containing subunit
MSQSQPKRTKTVAVLGASYGGISAVRVLEKGLPKGWKIVLVDRNRYVFSYYQIMNRRALKVSSAATRTVSFVSHLSQRATVTHLSD